MRWLAALLLVVLAARPLAAQGAAVDPVTVAVERVGDRFVATFDFPRERPAWGFFRSSPIRNRSVSWRPESWAIRTPGVVLVHRGPVDAFVTRDGSAVPRQVIVDITPYTGDLVADYVPALRLGDGIALFDGHFAAFSVADPTFLDNLPVDLRSERIEDGGTIVSFGPEGRFRLAGDIAGMRTGNSRGSYALYDVPVASVSDGVATIVDPAMPAWIAKDIAQFTPRVVRFLAGKMGRAGLEQPTVIASWAGANLRGASLNGGALTGLLMLRLEGTQVLEPDDQLRRSARWFIAHETAHFWLGQAVEYGHVGETWITEGGANLLAARTTASLVPGFDDKALLNDEIATCVAKGRDPIAKSAERQDFRAFYACGTVFALVAEAASGGDFFKFVERLIAANREDGKATREDWLAMLDTLGGKPALGRQINILLDDGAADPGGAIAKLFTEAGIAFSRGSDGIPRL